MILTNSTARELSDYEKFRQSQEMKRICLELKEKEGLSGNIRNFIAERMNVSPTQIARYDAINNNLSDELKEEFQVGNLGVSAAYELSKLGYEEQKTVFVEFTETGDLSVLPTKKQTERVSGDALENDVFENESTEPHASNESIPQGDIVFTDNEDKEVGAVEFVDIAETHVPQDDFDISQLWKNHASRKKWLNDYRSWGIWFASKELGLEWFRFDLARFGLDKTIIVCEYNSFYGTFDDKRRYAVIYMKPNKDLNGENPRFCPGYSTGEREIFEELKSLKEKSRKCGESK